MKRHMDCLEECVGQLYNRKRGEQEGDSSFANTNRENREGLETPFRKPLRRLPYLNSNHLEIGPFLIMRFNDST